MASTVNILTARITDADRPAINAKIHNTKTQLRIFTSLPCLKRSKGLSANCKIINRIPT